ncbi:MAG: hypothetical protein J6Q42_05100, partial [Clostridia bacterium]|nr:hypothetical protein [Clostridia bacterium]
KNSILLSIAGFKQNIIISTVLLLLYAICLILFMAFGVVTAGVLIIIYVFFLPAFRSFLIQFTVFPLVKKHIIDPYYKDHPDEDLDKRRDLNLADDDIQPEDAVFEDIGTQEKTVIPKQYSEEEMSRAKRISKEDEDDDTI